jgi:hypothetical protein
MNVALMAETIDYIAIANDIRLCMGKLIWTQ